MSSVQVQRLNEAERPVLCRMLEESEDFPTSLIAAYHRGSSHYVDFVATHRQVIVGVLSGSVDSDFFESNAFDAFELPPAPHAFLSRLHVTELFRRRGAGRSLVLEYVEHAHAAGCTFIGGSIDLSTSPQDRRDFFESCGFAIRDLDNFGASVADLRESRR